MKEFWQKLGKLSKRTITIGLALTLASTFSFAPVAQALSESDLDAIREGYPHYDPTEGEAGGCGITGTPEIEDLEEEQIANAITIIGVAKTLNLGEQGALIGLMTALVESGLYNYANDGTFEDEGNMPYVDTGLGSISQSLPHDKVGNDNDSVGVMQQRPSAGWSTFGSGFTEEIIGQLMTPAYAAQAFFGTPDDAELPDGLENPGALRKGLQNLNGNWQNMDPGDAAQDVQVSAHPDRYAERQDDAQDLLNQLWGDSLPVSLAVPVEGIDDGGSNQCAEVSGTAQQRILQTIATYAWPEYRPAGSDDALVAKSQYASAIREAADRGEYIGAGLGATCGFEFAENEVGADCGAFTTRVMRDSGVDPNYNEYEANTPYQLQYLQEAADEGKYTHIQNPTIDSPESGENALEPGDIAIRDGHTYFYVGDAMQSLVDDWEGITASASLCGRTAMAGPIDDYENYQWYRFTGSVSQQSSSINTPKTPDRTIKDRTITTNAPLYEWKRDRYSYVITREDSYAA